MRIRAGEVREGVTLLGGSLDRVDEAGMMAMPGGMPRMEVTLIRPGDSNNRMRYRPETLKEAVPLFEGAAAFCDHVSPSEEGRAGGRSLRDLVGVYEGVRWDEPSMSVKGMLRMYPGSDWLMTMVRESLADRAAGRRAPNVGISADMMVVKSPIVEGGGFYGRLVGWDVKKIAKVTSADVVFQPSAGGRFERILEGYALGEESREGLLVCKGCGKNPCQCQVEGDRAAEGTERGQSAGAVGVVHHAGSTGEGGRPPVAPTDGGTSDVVSRELEAVRAARQELCQTLLDQRLAGAGLPAPAVDWLRGRYAGRVFEATELAADMASVRSMLGGVVAPGVVRGVGPAGGSRIEGGQTSLERVQLAVDRLFGMPLPDAVKDVPKLSGIREAYIVITGDSQFTGRYNWDNSVLREVREADEVTTSIMANVVLNSMTKRLVADYQAQPKWWLPIAVRVPLRDMKAQDRLKLYDFAVMPTVNEGAAYVNLAWDDTKESYTPVKKGSLVTITLETIINDDLRAVTRMPGKLAAAAAVTINEFVSALFTAQAGTGVQMTDTYYTFDAANHQSNTGAAALSSATVKAAMIVLAKMTNTASKRIGVIGRHLLVPPDLMYTAQVIAGTQSEPGTANNDINPLNGKLNPIVVPNWTDTNNWYLMADPSQVECIELGFLNGREEPELLVQDNPTAGAVFTNDEIAYKVRWIFGGTWLDYRGAYGAINA